MAIKSNKKISSHRIRNRINYKHPNRIFMEYHLSQILRVRSMLEFGKRKWELFEGGSRTRRRPKGRGYGAAGCGSGNYLKAEIGPAF
jgi:hypothetical protein